MAGKITRFTRLSQQAGLSFDEAVALIKVSRSTGYRYQAGTGEPSGAAITLLEEAAAARIANVPGWFRFIDLFAGIGGLRKGFESIGGRCVFTSEWDLNSQKTYANNFPDNHAISGDIREFSADPSLVPEHDCHSMDMCRYLRVGAPPQVESSNLCCFVRRPSASAPLSL